MAAANPLVPCPRAPAALLLRDVRVLDPRARIDARHDVRVRGGEIAELGTPEGLERLDGEEGVEGHGRLTLPPAVFDPHGHPPPPGQEHKEDLESGTRAAAAGGYGGVIAMPNTDPTVDSAPVLRRVRDDGAETAPVPVDFLASITRRLEGQELTEMAELRDEGALGFT